MWLDPKFPFVLLQLAHPYLQSMPHMPWGRRTTWDLDLYLNENTLKSLKFKPLPSGYWKHEEEISGDDTWNPKPHPYLKIILVLEPNGLKGMSMRLMGQLPIWKRVNLSWLRHCVISKGFGRTSISKGEGKEVGQDKWAWVTKTAVKLGSNALVLIVEPDLWSLFSSPSVLENHLSCYDFLNDLVIFEQWLAKYFASPPYLTKVKGGEIVFTQWHYYCLIKASWNAFIASVFTTRWLEALWLCYTFA